MKYLFLIILSAIFLPQILVAQEAYNELESEVFKARVISETIDGVGNISYDLMGLGGSMENQEIFYTPIIGIEDGNEKMEIGDKVLVQKTVSYTGEIMYVVIDYVREPILYVLAGLFACVVIFIGRKKGLRALLGLVASFFILMEWTVPTILKGNDPVLIGALSAFLILIAIIYITEGFCTKSHISILSVAISLGITVTLALSFSELAHLTGLAQEEAMFLFGAQTGIVSFKGLLLAGILIGTIGVLDDVIVAQVETVKQLRKANPSFSKRELFKRAYEVGNSHLGAIVNTLFLTYAGASLPLLALFFLQTEPFLSFSDVLNNELIATEIIRAFVGALGVAASMPVSTLLATYIMKDTIDA